jgi:hypothetical protein
MRAATGRNSRPLPFRLHQADRSRGFVTEGDMKASHWNGLIQALVLVRLGQEIGTDSPLARALAEVVRVVFTLGR